jgi:hypothetical protein
VPRAIFLNAKNGAAGLRSSAPPFLMETTFGGSARLPAPVARERAELALGLRRRREKQGL